MSKPVASSNPVEILEILNAIREKLGLVAQSAGGSGGQPNALADFQPGDNVMVQTVTFFWVGQVQSVVNGYLILDNASWVADTGRFDECLDKGTLAEKCVIKKHSPRISLASVVAVLPWTAKLPS